MGQYRERKIHQVDPQTGAILRIFEFNRFVTGVSFWTWPRSAGGARNVSHLLPLVRAGVRSVDGVQQERENDKEAAQSHRSIHNI